MSYETLRGAGQYHFPQEVGSMKFRNLLDCDNCAPLSSQQPRCDNRLFDFFRGARHGDGYGGESQKDARGQSQVRLPEDVGAAIDV